MKNYTLQLCFLLLFAFIAKAHVAPPENDALQYLYTPTGGLNWTSETVGNTLNNWDTSDSITSLTIARNNTNLISCPAAIIASFSPTNGPENTLVTFTGSNFTDTASIQFDGTNASFTIISDTELTAIIPAGISGNASIVITSSGGCTGNSANNFTLLASNCNFSDVYISEIYDAVSGTPGIIEIYNPRNTTITFNGIYELQRFGDVGDATPTATLILPNSIGPQQTYIIQLGSPIPCGLTEDAILGPGINENDEIKLLKNGVVIDVVNAPNERGYTVIRNANAVVPNALFVPTDWTVNSNENCTDLGMHTADPIASTPTITHPTSQEICEGDTTNFTVSVASGTYTYQWKVLDASGNWIDVVNNANYSGATTDTLTISATPDVFNNNQYYCEITSTVCNLVSNTVQLEVIDVQIDTIPNESVCTSFTLPNLTNGNYFTASGGTGIQLNAGDSITTTQTIFIFNQVGTAPNNCSNETSFTVTVNGNPAVDTLTDVAVCTSFTLPNLTNGNYFTASGGTGTQLNAGDSITTTQTIFIFNQVGTAPNNCSNETSFTVTVNGNPAVDTLTDEAVCTSFTLPILTNGNYFTASGGTGTQLNAGDSITTTQTIFIFNQVGTAPNNCSNETSFTVTVNGNPAVDTLTDEAVCTSFTLPNLTNGNYFTASGGTGTQLNAGDSITTTQTIFIFNQVGTAPNNCSNETSFTVTVNGNPAVDTLTDEAVCTSFTLPNLTNGNYFTASGGTGTQLNAGDSITTTQTIFIFNQVGTAPNNCSNETSFTVTVNGNPAVDTLTDEAVCTSFTLPILTNGNYFTASGGTGTQLNAGDSITTTQTIFIFNQVGTAPNNCSNETSFTVTVSGNPAVDTLTDVAVCTSFTLPNLTNGNYFTASGGTGTQLNAGDSISTTQTIFIFNQVGTAPNNCSNETSFTVTVNGNPAVDTSTDVAVCTSFTLPNLTNGNYFTASGGTGTQLNAGDSITTTQTIFIFNQVGTAPNNCSNETSFTVTVNGNPAVDTLTDVAVCTSFTLPNLTNGNYFTASGGTGTQLNAGDSISTTQTIFIFNQVGTAPNNCSNETSFTVTVNGNPAVDTLTDEAVCTSFTLPILTNGNYFTASGGTGTQLNAGDSITTTQTIFIFNQVGTAPNNCSNETSFTVSVNGNPAVDTLTDEAVCTSFTLPNLTNGNYFTASGGTGTQLNAGDSITTTQTIFIFNQVGTAPNNCSNETSFTVTVNGNPAVDTLTDVAVCTSFTLPNLTNGNYFTASGGTGTQLNAGDSITTTQTIFIFNQVGTAPNNCSNESSFDVTIFPATDFSLQASNISITDNNIVVNMTDLAINYLYALDSGSLQTNPVFTNIENGNHILFVQDDNGCVIKQLAFTINNLADLNIPLYFTPNGDNVNDTWLITDNQNIIKDITIFNRFGKLLKQITSSVKSWDGRYNGNVLESNDYWYLITLKSGQELKGHFSLRR